MKRRVAVASIGLLWGAFCGLTNGLPIATTLAQMAVPWMWVAALVGYRYARDGRHAALLGGVVLVWANVAYFGLGTAAQVIDGVSVLGGVRFFILWSAVGLLVGPMAGFIGWSANRRPPRVPAIAALAAVSLAEPLALWFHINHVDAHITYVVVALAGLLLPLLWIRTWARKALAALAIAIAAAYPLAVVLEIVLIALGQVSAPLRLV